MDADVSAPIWQSAWGLLIFFALLILFFYYLYWRTHLKGKKSPFSNSDLVKGEEIFYHSADKIYQFLSELDGAENNPIDLSKASFCRDTKRIFPNTINAFGEISLGRNYLMTYYTSKLHPWFTLSDKMKQEIKEAHGSLDKFQTGQGIKPGPLYVDKKNLTLVGWQQVPETEMEIIVIKKRK